MQKKVLFAVATGIALGTALSSANAAVITVLDENFDASTSLPTGWSKTNNVAVVDDVNYAASGNNTLWIVETKNGNVVTAPTLNLTGGTEATLSFLWTTNVHSSAFGRRPQVQYSSDGLIFSKIGEFTVPANTSTIPPHTLFSQTITALGGYAFTANSTFRIVGDDDAGGNGAPAIIDNFKITSDVPEPAAIGLLGLGGLLMGRRRR